MIEAGCQKTEGRKLKSEVGMRPETSSDESKAEKEGERGWKALDQPFTKSFV
jgi:hypothetical protein